MRAYDDWVRVKDMRDQSIRCLDLKSKPRLVVVPAHDDLRGSQTSLMMTTRRSQSSIVSGGGGGGGGGVPGNLITINTTNPMRSKENRDVIEFCIDVGKALKKVDRCVRIEMMMMMLMIEMMWVIMMMMMMTIIMLTILKAHHHHPSI